LSSRAPITDLASVALALTAAMISAGCAAVSDFWDGVRESQRRSSIELSRELVDRGTCDRALGTIERAQTRRQLGAFAAESVWLKARCLAGVGRVEESLAHWRMLADQYADSRWVARIPPEVAPALGSAEPYRARAAPEAFEIPGARYGEGAQRASIAGSVWVEYRLDEAGRPGDLRVIGAAHPLLAAYALEAVAAGRWRESAGRTTPLPRRAGSAFRFESLWMKKAAEEPLTGGDAAAPPHTEDAPPDSGDDADAPARERDEEGVEWFPDR